MEIGLILPTTITDNMKTKFIEPICIILGLLWGTSGFGAEEIVIQRRAVGEKEALYTQTIQAAIDAVAEKGGGTVTLSGGTYLCGGLRLKSNVTLRLKEGAVLKGSSNYLDYGSGEWSDALIKGEDLTNIRVVGKGIIDGVDCRNPKGEEGFRGPHGILLSGCKDIVIRDITLKRTGNYAILSRNSRDAEIHKVTFFGGHDGIHAQDCRGFRIHDCNIRTGDDCIAGCDNIDFKIVDCRINSSCNGFRFGCDRLLVRGCRIWGPGEYEHQVSDRQNMLSAFVHFAPRDRDPNLPSDRWLIEDVKIDNVGFVYGYDIEKGLWQTGQPAKRLHFKNIRATDIEKPVRVLGDPSLLFELTLENSTIALREDCLDQPVLDLIRFGSLILRDVTLVNSGNKPAVKAKEGKVVHFERVTCKPSNPRPFELHDIDR